MTGKLMAKTGFWMLGCLGLATALGPNVANAAPYYFSSINGGTVANQQIAENDLFFELSQSGLDVVFKFQNSGSAANIAQIYFDLTGPLFTGTFSLGTDSGDGVEFAPGATPSNLPSGEPIDFTADYATGATPPPAHNGIDNPGEFLNVILANKLLADVENALVSFALLVGIHAISFPNGDSMALVNNPNPGQAEAVVPVPAALPLLLGGLGGLAWLARRNNRKSQKAV